MIAVGSIIGGDFRIVRPLSEGGMGAVFVAEQLSTGNQRALKVMQPQLLSDHGMRARFEQEARVVAHIQSDHVVQVVAAGVDAKTASPWIAMELLRGEDLATAIDRLGVIPRDDVLLAVRQLFHALGAAHHASIVHRDLKPENLFLAAPRISGLKFTLKVLDFGISKMLQDARIKMTAAMGTPMWMAPEQTAASTAIGPPTDIWAVGLIVFRALTGGWFWRSLSNPDARMNDLFVEVLSPAHPPASVRAAEQGRGAYLPPGFDAWFSRCVQREPRDRFASIAECEAAFESMFAAPPPPSVQRQGTIVMKPEPPPSMPTPSSEPREPLDPARIRRRLLHASASNERLAAICLSQVLALLGVADANEAALAREGDSLRPAFQARIGDRWRDLVGHPEKDLVVDELFAAIAPIALAARIAQRTAGGLSPSARPETRVAPNGGDVFSRCFFGLAEVLSIPAPELHRVAGTERLSFLPTEPPASSVSPAVDGLRSREIAFWSAHHLSRYRPEQRIRTMFQKPSELRALVYAACRAVVPDIELPPDAGAAARSGSTMLQRMTTVATRPRLERAVNAFLHAGASSDIRRWLQLSELEAIHAGLLCAGDVILAARLAGEPQPDDGDLRDDEKRRALLEYAVSDRHLEAMKTLRAPVP